MLVNDTLTKKKKNTQHDKCWTCFPTWAQVIWLLATIIISNFGLYFTEKVSVTLARKFAL